MFIDQMTSNKCEAALNAASKIDILLSELYQSLKEPIAQAILECYRNTARTMLSKNFKTTEEELFVNDFLSTIVDFKVAAAAPTTSTPNLCPILDRAHFPNKLLMQTM